MHEWPGIRNTCIHTYCYQIVLICTCTCMVGIFIHNDTVDILMKPYICTCTHVHIHVYMYVYMYMYIYMYTCMCVYYKYLFFRLIGSVVLLSLKSCNMLICLLRITSQEGDCFN